MCFKKCFIFYVCTPMQVTSYVKLKMIGIGQCCRQPEVWGAPSPAIIQCRWDHSQALPKGKVHCQPPKGGHPLVGGTTHHPIIGGTTDIASHPKVVTYSLVGLAKPPESSHPLIGGTTYSDVPNRSIGQTLQPMHIQRYSTAHS